MSSKRSPRLVLVMGGTGVGKSLFCRLASGNNSVVVGHTLEPETKTVETIPMQFGGRNFMLVDTPGFDDTFRTDAEILQEIAAWLADAYSAGTKLSGLIYMHRITDHRFTGASGKLLKIFKDLVGPESFSSIVFVTSFWDVVDNFERAVHREKQLVSTAWSYMIERGARVARFDATHERSMDALRLLPLFSGVVTLKIQEEMVDQHKSLEDTAAGRALQDEHSEWVLRHQRGKEELLREIELLKSQMKAQLGESNFQLQMEVDAQTQALREQLQRLQMQEGRKIKIEVEEESFPFRRPAGGSSTFSESSKRHQDSNAEKGGFKSTKGASNAKKQGSSTDERGDDTEKRDDAKTFNLYRELADNEIRLVNLHAGEGSLAMEIELIIEKYDAKPEYDMMQSPSMTQYRTLWADQMHLQQS